jgi:hypothetical protein
VTALLRQFTDRQKITTRTDPRMVFRTQEEKIYLMALHCLPFLKSSCGTHIHN